MVSLPDLEFFLKKHKLVGLDSNILIYFIEAHPQYSRLAKTIFESIDANHNSGVCATLSLLEILVQPYRMGDEKNVNRFYGLLTTYPNIEWVELSAAIADLGARLRAKYGLRTPDAILLATAIQSGATGFIGNDTRLKRVVELDVLTLVK